jgi:hypothetical protein
MLTSCFGTPTAFASKTAKKMRALLNAVVDLRAVHNYLRRRTKTEK